MTVNATFAAKTVEFLFSSSIRGGYELDFGGSIDLAAGDEFAGK